MKSYTIKEGSHSSGFRFWPLFKTKKMRVKVKFHRNCLYKPEPLQGVNKLFGFSQGFNHMEKSLRYGWTSDGEKIILHHFDHVNGEFSSREAGTMEVGEERELVLLDNNPSAFGYRLFPYFGGRLFAPHDMTIDIEWM